MTDALKFPNNVSRVMLPGHPWMMRVPILIMGNMYTCTREVILDADIARGLGLAVEPNYPWDPVIVKES